MVARAAIGQGNITDTKITQDASGNWTASINTTYTPPADDPADNAPLAMVLRDGEGKLVGGDCFRKEPVMSGTATRQVRLGSPTQGWIPLIHNEQDSYWNSELLSWLCRFRPDQDRVSPITVESVVVGEAVQVLGPVTKSGRGERTFFAPHP